MQDDTDWVSLEANIRLQEAVGQAFLGTAFRLLQLFQLLATPCAQPVAPSVSMCHHEAFCISDERSWLVGVGAGCRSAKRARDSWQHCKVLCRWGRAACPWQTHTMPLILQACRAGAAEEAGSRAAGGGARGQVGPKACTSE